MNFVTVSDRVRFWSKVDKNGPIHPEVGQCWIWEGRPGGNGYGQFSMGKRTYSVHRLSYIIHYGDISHRLQVMHTCDNKLCVNPAHLTAGTLQDNVDDREIKLRSRKYKRYQK